MPGERKRRHHQRSRNGCITCKQRHMRCDETKPYCRNCLKNGGNCGYSGAEGSNLNSPSLELSEEQMMLWTPSSVASSLSDVGSDQFGGVLQVTMCEESNMLFDHSKLRSKLITKSDLSSSEDNHYRTLTRTPIRKKATVGEGFDLVTSDTALMHTALLLSAQHYVLLGGNPATVASALYHHKVEAIRIINERLGDPTRATLDGTVGAVAGMALAEITCGSPEIATHHLNGLEHLMQLRGDLHSKGLSGFLQRMILLADTLISSATQCQLRFPGNILVPESSRRSSVSTFRSSSALTYTSSTGSESVSSDSQIIVDWDTTKMLRDLQFLSGQVAGSDDGTFTGDRFELIDSICVAEKHIDSMFHERIERVDPMQHNIEFASQVLEYGNPIPVGAFALSGTIYVYLFLRRIPIHSPVFDWMVDLVRQEFERTETIIRQIYPPELLFWLLFIAGSASLGRSERSWFRGKLARYRGILRLNRWSGVKAVLERLAWLEAPGDLHGKTLWEELENSR